MKEEENWADTYWAFTEQLYIWCMPYSLLDSSIRFLICKFYIGDFETQLPLHTFEVLYFILILCLQFFIGGF